VTSIYTRCVHLPPFTIISSSRSSSSSSDLNEFEEQKKGKSWPPARLAALLHFSIACNEAAAAEWLQLRPVEIGRALEQHFPGTFGDTASVSRALKQAMPNVPEYELPLQLSFASQKMKQARDTARSSMQ